MSDCTTATSSSGKRLLSVGDLCDTLSIKRTTAFALIRDREVVSIKIGRRTLILADSVDAFIERCPRAGDC